MKLHYALLRLAHQKPELRAELVPLVRLARGHTYGKPTTGKYIRVRWNPDDALLIEELPGKPVKRRVRRMEFNTKAIQYAIVGSSAFDMSNLMQKAKFTSSMTYDQAVKHFYAVLMAAAQTAIKETQELAEKWPQKYTVVDASFFKQWGLPSGLGYEQEVSYLEVEPADYKPILFKGKDFGGVSEWGQFRFHRDADEDEYMRHNEGMQAFFDNKSKGAARKLFMYLKADPDAVKGMTFNDFKAWLDRNKIGYNYVPTVWR